MCCCLVGRILVSKKLNQSLLLELNPLGEEFDESEEEGQHGCKVSQKKHGKNTKVKISSVGWVSED